MEKIDNESFSKRNRIDSDTLVDEQRESDGKIIKKKIKGDTTWFAITASKQRGQRFNAKGTKKGKVASCQMPTSYFGAYLAGLISNGICHEKPPSPARS